MEATRSATEFARQRTRSGGERTALTGNGRPRSDGWLPLSLPPFTYKTLAKISIPPLLEISQSTRFYPIQSNPIQSAERCYGRWGHAGAHIRRAERGTCCLSICGVAIALNPANYVPHDSRLNIIEASRSRTFTPDDLLPPFGSGLAARVPELMRSSSAAQPVPPPLRRVRLLRALLSASAQAREWIPSRWRHLLPLPGQPGETFFTAMAPAGERG